jgi:hypothetical protein
MVYLEDSQRAAAIAKVESGLHLNFTIAFTAPEVHLKSIEHQKRLAACLKSIDLPGLSLILRSRTPLSMSFHLSATNSKGYSESRPWRIDGHQRMHLCGKHSLQRLLPAGGVVRRNSSFLDGEKSFASRIENRAG